MVNRAKFPPVVVAILVAAVGAVNIRAQSRDVDHADRAALRKKLRAVNRSFTYRGKAINPRAIRDLIPWTSDRLPGPVAIDVEGTYGSNRYFGDYTTEGRRVSTDYKAEGGGSFGYEHLGVLANGFHVLRTYDHGGGSGIFQSLLLVKCVIDSEYDHEGGRRDRLVLLRVGEIGLGDRYLGKVKLWLKKDMIEVGADGVNQKKGFTVRLQ